jgi:hypothetical protein
MGDDRYYELCVGFLRLHRCMKEAELASKGDSRPEVRTALTAVLTTFEAAKAATKLALEADVAFAEAGIDRGATIVATAVAVKTLVDANNEADDAVFAKAGFDRATAAALADAVFAKAGIDHAAAAAVDVKADMKLSFPVFQASNKAYLEAAKVQTAACNAVWAYKKVVSAS